MKSIELYTEEIDDIEEAIQDLLAQAKEFEFKKNSMAILFADEDMDYEELYKHLSKEWDFPIIGCTALAMLTGTKGYVPSGIAILILSADDCQFSVGMTGELNIHNYKEELNKTYQQVQSKLSSREKLVISYGSGVMEEDDAPGNEIVKAISALGNREIPLFGACASDGFSFENFHVYCNGEITRKGQVIALIAGNVNPHFVSINSVGDRASFLYEITKSNSNKVYEVGNTTFVEALKKEGMQVEKTNVMGDYILTPFVVTMVMSDGDRIEVTRNLSMLNHETGAGVFMGNMPQGSTISIGLLNRGELKSTVEEAFEIILKELAKCEDKYETLLCSSCCARFIGLANNTSLEGDTYLGRLPKHISLIGMYGYGEYCPVTGKETGRRYNMFHNYTFTILAF
ncbi:MAG: FIST C-terminal domain-containing protein [Lachnospiraceae bacterium]|nr:FIST C-terminal domain-containing protein [Lachnospiraceae bacterium]